MSKAFDTVSHDAVVHAVREVGLPASFVAYIQHLYASATTTFGDLRAGNMPVKLGRGVKQGDPLSPLLFNLVVDRALRALSRDVGFELSGERINVLAYADDLLLLSSTAVGMQLNLTRLATAIERVGLTVNTTKSGVLSLVASGRDKKVKVVTEGLFVLSGCRLPQRSPVEIWKYLGVEFEGARVRTKPISLEAALLRFRGQPLKPQQKLHLLREHFLPRWVVGHCNTKCLKRADIAVRKSICTWLRLPNDVPTGYFHAPIQSGGHGIPMLAKFIPILKFKRLERLARSDLASARAASESSYAARQAVWCENQMRVGAERIDNTAQLGAYCARTLHDSNDGHGLRETQHSALSSHWVAKGALAIPGADYVHYHHVRANCLPTRVRTSRGRPNAPKMCRAMCPSTETAAHAVQGCFRTHGGRILRHDDLCRKVSGFLEQKGWTVEREKSFPTSKGRRRPDLIAVRGGHAVVVDAQVVSSEVSLEEAYHKKVDKYESLNDLVDNIASHTGVDRTLVVFDALTINWRGVWCQHSESSLLGMGLTRSQLRTLTTRVLQGSWMNWKRFNAMTTVYRRHTRDGVG